MNDVFIGVMVVTHNNFPKKGQLGTYFCSSTFYRIEDNETELILHCSDNTTYKFCGEDRIIALQKLKEAKRVLEDI
ncbi:MAG: hypothetical protein QNJ37_18625 [Crocosphaera sp.]|nr:hypothetical protein [Crocosphaera sp.]